MAVLLGEVEDIDPVAVSDCTERLTVLLVKQLCIINNIKLAPPIAPLTSRDRPPPLRDHFSVNMKVASKKRDYLIRHT